MRDKTDYVIVDFSKAIKDLNHNPIVDPEEGIKRTAEWMKNQYNL